MKLLTRNPVSKYEYINIRDHITRARLISFLIAVCVGALYAWISRDAMNADGIAYLDIGDAYINGAWDTAINTYWSPLYSWILGIALAIFKPSPYWEFTVVHVANFFIYLAALACLDFFLKELIEHNRLSTNEKLKALPEWSLIVLGYAVFTFTAMTYITMWLATPDMLVAGFVFLLSGLMFRLSRNPNSYRLYAAFGIILGISYLAKSSMFVLGFVYIAGLLFAVKERANIKAVAVGITITVLAFAIISVPFIAVISYASGEITFGDSGKLNYSWWLNDTPRFAHWQGQPVENGTPVHPTKKINNEPPVFEFSKPFSTTYPVWLNPAYWHKGLKMHLNLEQQISLFGKNVMSYMDLIFRTQWPLLLGISVLVLVGKRWDEFFDNVADFWTILLPSFTGMLMYLLVVEFRDPRYIAPFIVITWIILYSSVRLDTNSIFRSNIDIGEYLNFTPLIVAVLILVAAQPSMPQPYNASVFFSSIFSIRDLGNNEPSLLNENQRAAAYVADIGIKPGEKIAYIGDTFIAFFARLARIHVVAEIPSEANLPESGGDLRFWASSSSDKANVMKKLTATGARAVFTYATNQRLAEYLANLGWKQLGDTGFYYHILRQM